MAKAAGQMIVDHADGLHVGIENGAAQKPEAQLFHLAGDGIGERRVGGHFPNGFPVVDERTPVGEAPDPVAESAVARRRFQKDPGVVYRAFDFAAVADDACILHEPLHIAFGKTRHLLRGEIGETAPVAFPPVQDGVPGKPRLGRLQNEKLEMRAIVEAGHAPFPVVIVPHQLRTAFGPAAAGFAVLFHGRLLF